MPTNEIGPEEAEEERPKVIVERVGIVAREVIRGGDAITARLVVLFAVALSCVTLAQVPFNAVGAAAIGLIALDVASHRR